jgi:hypothetical protein
MSSLFEEMLGFQGRIELSFSRSNTLRGDSLLFYIFAVYCFSVIYVVEDNSFIQGTVLHFSFRPPSGIDGFRENFIKSVRLTDWVKEVWFSFHHTSFNFAELTVDFIVSKN